MAAKQRFPIDVSVEVIRRVKLAAARDGVAAQVWVQEACEERLRRGAPSGVAVPQTFGAPAVLEGPSRAQVRAAAAARSAAIRRATQ